MCHTDLTSRETPRETVELWRTDQSLTVPVIFLTNRYISLDDFLTEMDDSVDVCEQTIGSDFI